ncbi:hypothetical protein UFOVP1351_48 [uncultured Caudovirales phage]|uniref:Uncharacterized protein n=1 Tax=uncultured Caudovirales phage TaxID=2100421 RepID=A0A6J5RT68_9CAUD|nr:hypothetical protein UFOVP1351_48 [uncultured Caudovirales phage]
MKFKVGDRVTCINATGTMERLELGKEYVIDEYSQDIVHLDGVKGFWIPGRFQLTTEAYVPMQMRKIQEGLSAMSDLLIRITRLVDRLENAQKEREV